MYPRRILFVDNESLLMGATRRLLENNGIFAVVNLYANDMGELLRHVAQINPHVILMDEDTCFIEPMHLLGALQMLPTVRLIVLNKRDITVDIFDKRQLAIADAGQLMEALTSGAG